MNPGFVLDASLTLSWAFEGEATPFTDHVLTLLKRTTALVPALWPFEVASVLATAERRCRINAFESTEFLERLRNLPIAVERRPASWLCWQMLPLTRKYGLSAYDAAYLELAHREGLALATLDKELQNAARAHGVELLEDAGL